MIAPPPAAQIAPLPADALAALQARLNDYPGGLVLVGRRSGESVRFDVVRGTGAPDAGPDTPFELGALTDVFTGVLFADALRRGEVGASQPIDELIPDGAAAPARGERHITLGDLATQRAGLPPLPFNGPEGDPRDPFAAYDRRAMYDFLSHFELQRAPGAQFQSSDFSFALLGTLLADRSGRPYADLVKERIFDPLHLRNAAGDTALDGRLLPEIDGDGGPAQPWHYNALAPMGQVRASAADLLTFAAAAFSDARGALADDLRAALAGPYGWTAPAPGMAAAGGGTGGADGWLGILPAQHTATVLLANVGLAYAMPLDDVGIHLLDASRPLTVYAHPALDPATLARYVGRYRLTGGTVLTVERDARGLTGQLPGQPRLRLWPASATTFAFRQLSARIDFAVSATGRVTGATLHQDGSDTPLIRLATS